MGQFKDDAESSQFRTLLARYPPGHVLYEKHGLMPHTSNLIHRLLPSVVKDALVAGTLQCVVNSLYSSHPWEWPD